MSGETYPTDLLGEDMSNLIRLGIIGEIAAYSQYPSNDPHVTNPQWSIEQVASEDFFLTDFGWNFIKACKRDSFSPQI
ncbi:hypothetical protein ASE92_17270 [Pedobacter sp. Leaf41]|uniref:hypothetical protein n=1 Tax=Pedobacter sp. Leaf41 TaxID=1736218 RepID=UPI000703ABD6|nr:hypothetical protein [Pedobacter sp. Leaf41]KQN32357.1 hypothetical protein ASE92_17270 [Pedobacter sp. Leaf41]